MSWGSGGGHKVALGNRLNLGYIKNSGWVRRGGNLTRIAMGFRTLAMVNRPAFHFQPRGGGQRKTATPFFQRGSQGPGCSVGWPSAHMTGLDRGGSVEHSSRSGDNDEPGHRHLSLPLMVRKWGAGSRRQYGWGLTCSCRWKTVMGIFNPYQVLSPVGGLLGALEVESGLKFLVKAIRLPFRLGMKSRW